MTILNKHISIALHHYCNELQKYFQCPVIGYAGIIHPAFINQYIGVIETVSSTPFNTAENNKANCDKKLVIVLSTPGGVVEAVEKMVEITRHHFQEVIFVIPNAAMSAGTIFSMSGDKLYMDYTSSLGPIDPQLSIDNGQMVPALGYIDKAEEFIEKSKKGELSPVEFAMLKGLDLANLRRYEQARNLSINLLKEWLVKYKFKSWTTHRTTNPGDPVTDDERKSRAEEIAKKLMNNNLWHSHGRMIGIETVVNELKLEVEDYTNESDLRFNIRSYGNILDEFISQQNLPVFIHYASLEV